ncbi:hypothetical protein BKA93DRAFT_882070 [Sparassis latifolia]
MVKRTAAIQPYASLPHSIYTLSPYYKAVSWAWMTPSGPSLSFPEVPSYLDNDIFGNLDSTSPRGHPFVGDTLLDQPVDGYDSFPVGPSHSGGRIRYTYTPSSDHYYSSIAVKHFLAVVRATLGTISRIPSTPAYETFQPPIRSLPFNPDTTTFPRSYNGVAEQPLGQYILHIPSYDPPYSGPSESISTHSLSLQVIMTPFMWEEDTSFHRTIH